MDNTGSQSWGFNNVVLDVMKCQSTCSWCDYDLKCYACSTGLLYKNRCSIIFNQQLYYFIIPSCPPHSTPSSGECIDLDEPPSSNSKYIVKAFYDSSNTTDTDIPAIIGTISSGTGDFKTTDTFLINTNTIYFSYYLGKRVLGGPLVWNKATFTKTFNINPHYKFRIKFTLVLGDGFSTQGDFRYSIGGFSEVTLTYSQGTNIAASSSLGASTTDRQIQVDRPEDHLTPNTLQVVFKCNAHSSDAINQAFCLIYDYYILILECTQYCTACTGPTWNDCTGKLGLPTGMSTPTSCVDSTYYLNTSVTPSICTKCSPVYCLECIINLIQRIQEIFNIQITLFL